MEKTCSGIRLIESVRKEDGSFLLGQADVFPESLRIMPLLCTPVLSVMLLMFYWLVRVLFMRWRPQI